MRLTSTELRRTIERRDKQMDGRTEGWTEERTDGPIEASGASRKASLLKTDVDRKKNSTSQLTMLREELKYLQTSQRRIRKQTCLFSFALVAFLLSPKPSDGQGMEISGTMLNTDENQARVAATGNSCRQGFPCGKYGQHYYWCWTSYGNGGDWDYCCGPDQTCGRHGMGYDWCWADSKKNTWTYCKKDKTKTKSKVSKPTTTSKPKVVASSSPETTTSATTTTTTTTTRRRTTTSRPIYTRSKQYTSPRSQSPVSSFKGSGGNQLQEQILSNVQSAVEVAVASSKQHIQKIDLKMERLEDNILDQERKFQKLDRMEQMQRDTNQTLTQITKWIRYLSTSVEGLKGMEKKVDVLAKESLRQRNGGNLNQMYKNALRSNEIDNNSISSPIYNYQRKGPSASPISSSSRSSSTRPMVVLNMPHSLIFFYMTGFLGFALYELITCAHIRAGFRYQDSLSSKVHL